MNLNEFRCEMESYRKAANEEARLYKDSYIALDRLHELYQRFDDEERIMADQVLGEWVLSEDENVRFDALVLITDFKIVKAKPMLQELAARLATSKAPSAPYELKKVNRILEDLDKGL